MKVKSLRCLICLTWFGAWRTHCPQCGTYKLHGHNYAWSDSLGKLVQIFSGRMPLALRGNYYNRQNLMGHANNMAYYFGRALYNAKYLRLLVQLLALLIINSPLLTFPQSLYFCQFLPPIQLLQSLIKSPVGWRPNSPVYSISEFSYMYYFYLGPI